MLFTFGETKTPLCSFCHSYDEAYQHIILECICVKYLWNNLTLFPTDDISGPILTAQSAVFGFISRIESDVYKITIKFHLFR